MYISLRNRRDENSSSSSNTYSSRDSNGNRDSGDTRNNGNSRNSGNSRSSGIRDWSVNLFCNSADFLDCGGESFVRFPDSG